MSITALKRFMWRKGYIVLILIVVVVTLKFIYDTPTSQPFDTSDLLTKLHDGPGANLIKKREEERRLRLTSAVAGYCNHPENISLGAEGLPPDDYKLISVTVLIRHGNRLPMPDTVPLGPMSIPKVKCKLKVSKSSMPKLLGQFIAKVEHTETGGVDSQVWPYYLIPNTDLCEAADLTQIGVEQQLQNGRILREAYRDQLGGISQSHLNVTSTMRRRTYKSATAFIYGLLGDSVDFNSLHIREAANPTFCVHPKIADLQGIQGAGHEEKGRVEERSKRDLPEQYSPCYCEKIQSLMKQGETNLRTPKEDEDYLEFKNTVLDMLNMKNKYKVRSYYPWKTAHDLYMSRLCRKEPLPCNKKVCFTESQADLNWRSLSTYFASMSNEPYMIKASKLSVFYFLQEMIHRLLKHASTPADKVSSMADKFTLYSGHDNTLTPLLLALGMKIEHWPPFASRLVIELYRPKSGSTSPKDHIFKLIFNGEDITRKLKFCRTRVGWSKTGCSLTDLSNFHNSILPNMGEFTYRQACKVEKREDNKGQGKTRSKES